MLLDLSAAFDTTEHSLPLNILQQDFGVVGTALNWFDSFLSGRKQRILVGYKTSDDFSLNCGVSQGSCMGPIIFTLYVSCLFNIISQHLPFVHGYADDTQIYLSFQPCCIHSEIIAFSLIEKCIADVRSWFIGNRLMINDAKTDFLIIGTRQQLEKTSIESIIIGDTVIKPLESVRNLGSWFDAHMRLVLTKFRIGRGMAKRRSSLQLLVGTGICLSLRISGQDRGKEQTSTHYQKLMFQWREGTSGGLT